MEILKNMLLVPLKPERQGKKNSNSEIMRVLWVYFKPTDDRGRHAETRSMGNRIAHQAGHRKTAMTGHATQMKRMQTNCQAIRIRTKLTESLAAQIGSIYFLCHLKLKMCFNIPQVYIAL